MENGKRPNDRIGIDTRGVPPDRPITCSRNWVSVADVMSRKVATISPDETVVSAARMMSERKISCLAVMDNGNVAGIQAGASVAEAARVMTAQKASCIVALNGDERIFKIFQTIVPRDGVESTGIGLSIVQKIAELNGGKAWLESKVGEGSTFFFTLQK